MPAQRRKGYRFKLVTILGVAAVLTVNSLRIGMIDFEIA
jgi:hypothetical protein